MPSSRESMFEQLPVTQPDAILGLNEAFQADPNPDKVNLTLGVYVNQAGQTPILNCVKEAERRLLAREDSKIYLNIAGDPTFRNEVQQLLLGSSHRLIADQLCVTLQTPGGTGALRVVADFVHQHYPRSTVWVSDPTWPNHPKVFAAAGVPTACYPYYDATAHGLDLTAYMEALDGIHPADFVILHGCCHNPTGVDPEPDTWRQIADTLRRRQVIPIVDIAYQGFGRGLDDDAVGVRTLVDELPEVIICNSFSKSFGLYRERTGALTVTAANAAAADKALGALKQCVRRNYSNPPSHGGAIVATILSDSDLRQSWISELGEMSGRIRRAREMFVQAMADAGCAVDLGYLRNQLGMFSLLGLSPDKIDALRAESAVYLVRNGRLNLAGIQEHNLDYVVQSLLRQMAP